MSSAHTTCVAALRGHPLYWEWKEVIMREVVDDLSIPFERLEETAAKVLIDRGGAAMLRGRVYRMALPLQGASDSEGDRLAPPITQASEPLDIVAQVQKQWRGKIRDQTNLISNRFNIPLIRKRSPAEQDMSRADREAGAMERCRAEGLHPAYNYRDVFDMILRMSNPNHSSTVTKISGWGCVRVELAVASMEELRSVFHALAATVRHTGCDDVFDEEFAEERSMIGERISSVGDAPMARSFAQRGVPTHLRQKMWLLALGIDSSSIQHESLHLDVVRKDRKYDLLADMLARVDIEETANDEGAFIFADTIADVVMAFIRDPWVAKQRPAGDSCVGATKAGRRVAVYPPSGVVPFLGLSMYVAPLCYVFPKTREIYVVFRELYVRYFAELQCFRSEGWSTLRLSKQFEDLLQECHPSLFFHVRSLGCHPLEHAFPWLFSCFVGYLEFGEVLHLMDRVIGYDSLLIVSVLAAAIFLFRARALLKTRTPADVAHVLEDLSEVRVVALLQWFLFQRDK